MSVLTDNNITKKYYNISKYKDLEIEIEKMWLTKNITEPVIVGSLGMIQKATYKDLNKIPSSPSQYVIKKLLFVELLISLGGYNQYYW